MRNTATVKKQIAIGIGIAILSSGCLLLRPDCASAEDDQQLTAIFEKADRFCRERRYSQSIDLLEHAVNSASQAEPDEVPRIRERLARTLYLAGRYPDAIEQLKASIATDPNVAEYYSELAWLYSVSENYREAVRYANQAIKLDANHAYPYTVLGFSLANLGKAQQAKLALQRALELDPNNASACLYLGDVLASNGEVPQAMAAYQRVLELDQGSAAAYIGLGSCYQKSGKTKDALDAYKHAVELAPQDATARGHLGFALSQAGDYPGAFRNGMTANFIRINQSWHKFIGMFLAVWAGIFLAFGGIFGALFIGSRFKPQPGESVLGQFLLVFYRDRPGRFVITDRRLVFVPELISQSLGATRVSIERDQIKSILSQSKATAGSITVVSTSDTTHLFRMPLMVLSAILALMKDQGLIQETDEAAKKSSRLDGETDQGSKQAPERVLSGEQSGTDDELVTAVSYDFRQSQNGEDEQVQG